MMSPILATTQHGNALHLFRELARTSQVLIAGLSRELGMPASLLPLMRLLAQDEAGAGTMDLARQLGINAAAVTRQLQAMKREGLVLRRGDLRDARRCRLTLSAKGRKQFDELHDRSHALEQALASALGTEELRATAEALARLRTVLETLFLRNTQAARLYTK